MGRVEGKVAFITVQSEVPQLNLSLDVKRIPKYLAASLGAAETQKGRRSWRLRVEARPNAASGVIAALFPFVLSVVTAGTVSMLPDRLAGWWLASAASTVAVLVLSPPSPGDRLRAAAAGSARALANTLDAAVRGTLTPADKEACQAAKHQLLNAFASTPFRPTGLATADQGLANITEVLEWVTSLTADALDGHVDVRQAAPADRELLGAAVSAQEHELPAAALLQPVGRPTEPRLARNQPARLAWQLWAVP